MLHSSLSYMGARGHHVKQRDFPRLEARDIRLSFSTYIYGILDLFVSASFGTPPGEECCQIESDSSGNRLLSPASIFQRDQSPFSGPFVLVIDYWLHPCHHNHPVGIISRSLSSCFFSQHVSRWSLFFCS